MKRRDWISMAAGAAAPLRAQTRKIRYGVSMYPGAATFFTALERGYFDQAGIELEIERNQSGAELVQLLAGGRLDAVQGSITPALLGAISRGLPLKAVFAREQVSSTCEGFGWVRGLASSFPGGLKNLSELRGKKIAYGPAASIGEFALDRILESAGLDRGSVTPVNSRPFEAMAALAAGRIDAIVSAAGVDFRRFSKPLAAHPGLTALVPGFQTSFIIFGKGMLEAPSETGTRFLQAMLRGVSDFRAGYSPKFFEELAGSSRTDVGFLRGACRGGVCPDGVIVPGGLQQFIDWCRKRSYLQQPLETSAVVDGRFLAAVKRG